MPFSTNAPFNEKGHAEQLRDIEYLYLKLQELFRATGINDGDLNPGGGQGVSQDNADDGLGTGSASRSTGPVAGVVLCAKKGASQSVLPDNLPHALTFDLVLVDSENGMSGTGYTVQRDGYYLINLAISAIFSVQDTLPAFNIRGLGAFLVNGAAVPGANPAFFQVGAAEPGLAGAGESIPLLLSLAASFKAGDVISAQLTIDGVDIGSPVSVQGTTLNILGIST